MRIVALAFGIFLSPLFWASAQITVAVSLEQEQFLRDESMPLKVRVANRSGQTLKLGADAEWLTFLVESRDASSVNRIADPLPEAEFSLESATVGTKKLDLMRYFDLSQPGSYKVTATVHIKAWNQDFSSPAKNFEIVRGAKLWEQEIGVPTTNGAPEVRKYALQQATYLKQFRLYARITDLDETKVFRVLPIGSLVSFSHPEAQVDRESNLHVLFQTGARSFQYCVITPAGIVKTRESHDYTQTRPILKSADDGKIKVAGGMRRYAPGELPPPANRATNDSQAPKS